MKKKTTEFPTFRPGDILIKQIAKLPDNLPEAKKDKIIVSSSNNHCLEEGKIYPVSKGLIVAYLELDKKSEITHKDKDGKKAEHENIPLEKGFYEVKRQRTYLPKGYEIVAD